MERRLYKMVVDLTIKVAELEAAVLRLKADIEKLQADTIQRPTVNTITAEDYRREHGLWTK